MECPKCGKVARMQSTRYKSEDEEVYRKYKCKSCGNCFYTVEFEVEQSKDFNRLWKSLRE